MDRRVPWLVFGLVVALVVSVGSIALAQLLPGAAVDISPGSLADRDPAHGPFAWNSQRAAHLRGVLAPIWLLLLVLVPLSLLALTITGFAWATRAGPESPAPRRSSCRNCRQEMEADWRLCPYCGEEG